MNVLGIETSGRIGGVALCRDDHVLSDYTFPEGARRARDILPAVDRVIREAGLDKHQIMAVAVSEGPGAFTGLRVGVACAKTLAFALGWKCAGIPSLEVKAQNVDQAECGCRFTCPVMDARRGRVCGAVYRWQDGWQDVTGVLCVEPQRLARRIPEGTLIFGDGIRAYPEVFRAERFHIGAEELQIGRAPHVARLGLERIKAGRDLDPVALVPRYYRLTYPEEALLQESEGKG